MTKLSKPRVRKVRVDRDCEDCQRKIGQRRLSAVPDATRCPNCQELHETREHLAGRGPYAKAREVAASALAEVAEIQLVED